MSTQEGALFPREVRGGKGKLPGGVPWVKPAKVFVIGAGVVGTARHARWNGCRRDDLRRLAQRSTLPGRRDAQERRPLMSFWNTTSASFKTADLVIGSVPIPGAKAPKLVTRDMLPIS